MSQASGDTLISAIWLVKQLPSPSLACAEERAEQPSKVLRLQLAQPVPRVRDEARVNAVAGAVRTDGELGQIGVKQVDHLMRRRC